MPTEKWEYWESGVTGWQPIVNILPNPNQIPIKDTSKSMQVRHTLADGSWAYVTPETKVNKPVVSFAWHFQSGMTVYDKLRNIHKDQDYFRIKAHVRDQTWTGLIKQLDTTYVIFGTRDYRDISIILEQIEPGD